MYHHRVLPSDVLGTSFTGTTSQLSSCKIPETICSKLLNPARTAHLASVLIMCGQGGWVIKHTWLLQAPPCDPTVRDHVEEEVTTVGYGNTHNFQAQLSFRYGQHCFQIAVNSGYLQHRTVNFIEKTSHDFAVLREKECDYLPVY